MTENLPTTDLKLRLLSVCLLEKFLMLISDDSISGCGVFKDNKACLPDGNCPEGLCSPGFFGYTSTQRKDVKNGCS